MKSIISGVNNHISKKPIMWSISGADCSGGAGIAADIKTGHNLGVEVCHFITANTVQNSSVFYSVNSTAIDILAQQAQALRFDKPPTVIKIGLIADVHQIQWLILLLTQLKSELPTLFVVFDPVSKASVGGNMSLFSSEALSLLLPLIDVITPNINEAKALSYLASKSSAIKTEEMAENILLLGCKAVIVKGGHASFENISEDKQCIDICLQSLDANSTQLFTLHSPKINTSYNHGGGCSFASALASFLAHNYLLRDAFTLTKAFINQGLLTTDGIDHQIKSSEYYGAFQQGLWPTKASDFPQVISPIYQQLESPQGFKSLGLAADEKLGLYPVVDSLSWLELLLPQHLKIIQLRIKSDDINYLEPLIAKAIAKARHFNCRLFINDHWQLAIKYGAYGVHIGQEDLHSADLNAIAKAGLRLGISTHGCYEFLLAKQLRPSYLAIGAIFPTKTKNMTGQIQGLQNLTQILALADTIPVVAIGGINQQRLAKVWSTGVNAIAVVTAITQAQQPLSATKSMQAMLC
jgi:hydroxymethylpyrimidine kinase/phosphomethylpyrimidine kinase/thiamine-phosphate diphosphorylase